MPECLWHKSLPKDFSSVASGERGKSTMFYLKAKNLIHLKNKVLSYPCRELCGHRIYMLLIIFLLLSLERTLTITGKHAAI